MQQKAPANVFSLAWTYYPLNVYIHTTSHVPHVYYAQEKRASMNQFKAASFYYLTKRWQENVIDG